MGLDRLPATSAVPPTADETHPSNLTGLAVLNNICHLIEHLHDLKMENNRLRAHLDLVSHVDRFLLRTPDHESKPLLRSTLSIHGEGTYDEEKSSTTLSPSNSLKIRKFSANSFSSKDRLGMYGELIIRAVGILLQVSILSIITKNPRLSCRPMS